MVSGKVDGGERVLIGKNLMRGDFQGASSADVGSAVRYHNRTRQSSVPEFPCKRRMVCTESQCCQGKSRLGSLVLLPNCFMSKKCDWRSWWTKETQLVWLVAWPFQ